MSERENKDLLLCAPRLARAPHLMIHQPAAAHDLFWSPAAGSAAAKLIDPRREILIIITTYLLTLIRLQVRARACVRSLADGHVLVACWCLHDIFMRALLLAAICIFPRH